MNRIAGDEAAGSAPTNGDIAAYVDGTADPVTRRRVVAAAGADKAVRARIILLRAAEAAPEDPRPLPPSRVDRLRARMRRAARAVADEQRVREP
jgi:anti-sigma factor RsiW